MDFELNFDNDTSYQDKGFINEEEFITHSVAYWQQITELHRQCCQLIEVQPEDRFIDEVENPNKKIRNEAKEVQKKDATKKFHKPDRKNWLSLLPVDHLPKFSRLSIKEHKLYLKLLHEYSGKVIENKTNRQTKEIQQLASLHGTVVKEQAEFIEHLKHASKVKKKDYLYLHPSAERYVKELLSEKLQNCLLYPKHYVFLKTLPIYKPGTLVKHTPILRLVSTLLELGKLPCLVQPSLDIACFILMDYEKLCRRFSPQKRSHKSKLPIHPSKEPVSQDLISKSLAEKHGADFVMSLSSLKALLDCQPNESRPWELPVHVIECNSKNDNRTEDDFKQVFVDKPLPSNLTVRQKNALYHKYAMKLKLTHFSQNTLKRSMAVMDGYDTGLDNISSCVEKNEGSRKLQVVDDNPFEEYTDELWDKETFGTSVTKGSSLNAFSRENHSKELPDKKITIKGNHYEEDKLGNKLLSRNAVDESKEIDNNRENKELLNDVSKSEKECKMGSSTKQQEKKLDLQMSKHNYSASHAEGLNESHVFSEKDSSGVATGNCVLSGNNGASLLKESQKGLQTKNSKAEGGNLTPITADLHQTSQHFCEYTDDDDHDFVRKKAPSICTPKRKRGRPPKTESCGKVMAKQIELRVTRSKSRLLHTPPKSARYGRRPCENVNTRPLKEEAVHEALYDMDTDTDDDLPLFLSFRRHKGERVIESSDSSDEIPLVSILKNEHPSENINRNKNVEKPSLQKLPEEQDFCFEKLTTCQEGKPNYDALSDDTLIIDEGIQQTCDEKNEGSLKDSCSVLNGVKENISGEHTNCSNVEQESNVKKDSLSPKKTSPKNVKKVSKSDNDVKSGESTLDKILHLQDVMLNTKGIICSPNRPCLSATASTPLKSSGLKPKNNAQPVAEEVVKKNSPSLSPGSVHHEGIATSGSRRDDRNQYPPIPPIDNVTYNLWNFEGWKLLLRSKTDCQVPPKNDPLFLFSKLEYQAQYGAEITTSSELIRQWTTLTFHPGTQALKVRINALNSELLMMEDVSLPQLTTMSAKFQPDHAIMQLSTILDSLKKLPVGKYLLVNKGTENNLSLHRSAEPGKRGPLILHATINQRLSALDSPLTWNELRSPPWLPVDPEVSLPAFKRQQRIPATFPPKYARKKHENREKVTHKKKEEKDQTVNC